MTSLPAFEAAPDAVDPRAVPPRRLRSSAELPAIGLGTFGSDRVSGEAVAHAVVGAASLGYWHFDCAAVYRNEHLIGPARHIGTFNMTIPKRPDVERLARWKLHPEVTVTHRFPLQRAAEAYRVADEGRSGKVVITFGGA